MTHSTELAGILPYNAKLYSANMQRLFSTVGNAIGCAATRHSWGRFWHSDAIIEIYESLMGCDGEEALGPISLVKFKRKGLSHDEFYARAQDFLIVVGDDLWGPQGKTTRKAMEDSYRRALMEIHGEECEVSYAAVDYYNVPSTCLGMGDVNLFRDTVAHMLTTFRAEAGALKLGLVTPEASGMCVPQRL
jgi:hypothetical protein